MPKTNESRWPILVVRNCPPPPHIRRAVSSQLEKHKKENDSQHPLYEQDPARNTLKSRHSFQGFCRTPWSQRPHSKTDSLVVPSPDNTTQALIQSQGIAVSRFEWGMTHLVKPKSPPDRDWTMQIAYAEMGIQRGWTDNVRMWEWTDHDTLVLLVCQILPQPCAHEDLEGFNPRDISCAQYWAEVV